jgi:hypothetical protein
LKKQKKHKTKKQVKDKSKKEESVLSKIIIRNLLSFALFAVIVYILYSKVPGYNWLWSGLIKGNLGTIEQYPDLTRDQKFEIKERPDAAFVNFLKNNTSDSSSIVFPPRDLLINSKRKFKRLHNKAWITYALYPREVEYFNELPDTSNLERFDFIAVFEYWGYDKVSYPADRSNEYFLLPTKIK